MGIETQVTDLEKTGEGAQNGEANGEANEVVEEPKVPPKTEVTIEEIMSDKPVDKAKAGTPVWAQRRFDELTAKNKRLEEELQAEKQKQIPEDRPMPPDRTTFDEETDYQKAMIDWKDADDAWKGRSSRQKQTQEEFERRQNDNVKRYLADRERLKAKFSDFDETVDPMVYDHVAILALESDLAPEILYFLGKNPSELARLKGLPPYVGALEIGKLEYKLKNAAKRTSTQAPAPITPVEGNDSVPKDPSKMSDKEWWDNEKRERIKKLKEKLNG